MTVADLVSSFIGDRCRNTQLAYGRDLEDLATFLRVPGNVAAASVLLGGGKGRAVEIVRDWTVDLTRRGLSQNTIDRRQSSIRSLTAAARDAGLVPWSLEAEQPPQDPLVFIVTHPAHRGWVMVGATKDLKRSLGTFNAQAAGHQAVFKYRHPHAHRLATFAATHLARAHQVSHASKAGQWVQCTPDEAVAAVHAAYAQVT